MTILELRETLTRLVELLSAADAKATTTRGLSEFIDSLAAFDELSLKAFVKLAEAGKTPPTPRAPSKTKANPESLVAEVKSLYENAGDEAVSEEDIRRTCTGFSALTKAALVRAAESIGLGGMGTKKKDEIASQITSRIMDRKAAAVRRHLIDRPHES